MAIFHKEGKQAVVVGELARGPAKLAEAVEGLLVDEGTVLLELVGVDAS